MADASTPADTEMDTNMGDETNPVAIDDNEDDIEADDDTTQVPATQDKSPAGNPQTVFLSYLQSPIVQLEIGAGDEATTISAHKAILTISPFFADALADPDTTTLSLPDDDVDAMACFLQYQYTGEYFPRRVPSPTDKHDGGLETDPSLPAIDQTGAQLLKHARVYTLAEKLGLPDLKGLAHAKIHRVNSTAVGEIAYARYVYGHTSADDDTIRRPVAAFWATRSHVLRHEAEDEFKTMCLEYPQFGFDVLSLVLDQREKRVREREEGPETGTPQTGKGRKRMRPSVNI